MSTFEEQISGEIRYGSGYEAEIAEDPFGALDTSDGAYSDSALAARIIASWFHGGQSSALYAFTSSGHFDRDDLLSELTRAACDDLDSDAHDACEALQGWIIGAPMTIDAQVTS